MSFDSLSKEKLNSTCDMTVQCSTPLQTAPISFKPIHRELLNCCNPPYQDHNYGTPLSSNQLPLPTYTDEDNKNTISEEAPTVKIQSIPKSSIGKGMKDFENSSGDLTRCICGFMHDDGYMICCDRCSVWQHIDCMEIDRNSIPDSYLCELCDPRKLNTEKARSLQQKKHEEFLSNTDIDSDEFSMDLFGHTLCNANLSSKDQKKLSQVSTNKRKRSADNEKFNHINDGRKRPRSKSFQCNGIEIEQEKIKCAWNENIRHRSSSYQELDGKNQYTDSFNEVVSTVLHSHEENANNTVSSLSKVEVLRGFLQALEDIVIGEPIIEYKGNFTLAKSFENLVGDFYEKPYSYVLLYDGFHGVNVCVDARIFGSKARFVRRSCCPNAEVRPVVSEGLLRLFIYSTKLIKNGDEITIPFDLNPNKCSYSLHCACISDECWVKKLNNIKPVVKCSKISSNNNNSRNSSCEHQNKDCGCERRKTQLFEDEDSAIENQKKKSREERKMEAYIRAFENLEKREKRRSSLHQHHTPTATEKTTHDNQEYRQLKSAFEDVSQCVTSCTESIVTSAEILQIPEPSPIIHVASAVKPSIVPASVKSRRQSTRARRPSAKLIDANGGLTNSYKTIKGELNLSLLPVSEDSCDAENQEVARFLSQPIACDFENTSSFDSTGNFSAIENTNSESLVDPPSIVENTNSDLVTSSLNSCFESTENSTEGSERNLPENLSPSVRLENCDMSGFLNISPNLFRLSSREKECKAVTSSAFSACVHSKHLAGSVQVFPTIDLKPVFPSVSCNYVPWNFKPGKPSGMVVISTTRYDGERRRSSPSKYIKKWWLKRAVNDSQSINSINSMHKQKDNMNCHNRILISEELIQVQNPNKLIENPPRSIVCEKISWKKKLVRQSTETPSVSSAPDSIAIQLDQLDHTLPENACDKEITATDEACEITNNGNKTLVDVGLGADMPIVASEPEDGECNDTENSCSEEQEITVHSESEKTCSSPKNMEDENLSKDLSTSINDEFDSDVEYEVEDTLGELSQEITNNNDKYPSRVKRKVSLQDYLKRCKDGEKPPSTVIISSISVSSSTSDSDDKVLKQDVLLVSNTISSPKDFCSVVKKTYSIKPSCVEKKDDLQSDSDENKSPALGEKSEQVIDQANTSSVEDCSESKKQSKIKITSHKKSLPLMMKDTNSNTKQELSPSTSSSLSLKPNSKTDPQNDFVKVLEEGELPVNIVSDDGINFEMKSRHDSETSLGSSITLSRTNMELSDRVEDETSSTCSTQSDLIKRGQTIPTIIGSDVEHGICKSINTSMTNRYWMNRSPNEHTNGYAQLPRASHKSQNNLMFSEWDSHSRRSEYSPPNRHHFNSRNMEDPRSYDNRQYCSNEYPPLPHRRPVSPMLPHHRRPFEQDHRRPRDSEMHGYGRWGDARKRYDRDVDNHSPPPMPDRHHCFQGPFSSGRGYRKQWHRNYNS